MSHLDPTTYRCTYCGDPLDSVWVTVNCDRYGRAPSLCEDCELDELEGLASLMEEAP